MSVSLTDIQNIAKKAASESNPTILGVTKSVPRYTQIPEDSGKYEFVVDCWLLENATQAVTIGSVGLAEVKDVLLASEATGDLLVDINIPVELRTRSTGQLEVVGRAKVALPALHLEEYDYVDLGIHHVAELEYHEIEKVWKDAFGVVQNLRLDSSGVRVSTEVFTSTMLSELGQLVYDDSNQYVGLGVNALQREITTHTRSTTVSSNTNMRLSETTSTV